MRQQIALGAIALVLVFTIPAIAQESRFEVSAFVEPLASDSDYDGFELDTGLGAGFGWRFSPDWTAEGRFLLYDAEFADAVTYQLGLRYSFLEADAPWRPFVNGGLHLGQRDLRREIVCVAGPCPDLEQSVDDTGLFVGGGVDWQANDWFALRLDGRLLIYDSDLSGDVEESADLTAGVVFRF